MYIRCTNQIQCIHAYCMPSINKQFKIKYIMDIYHAKVVCKPCFACQSHIPSMKVSTKKGMDQHDVRSVVERSLNCP